MVRGSERYHLGGLTIYGRLRWCECLWPIPETIPGHRNSIREKYPRSPFRKAWRQPLSENAKLRQSPLELGYIAESWKTGHDNDLLQARFSHTYSRFARRRHIPRTFLLPSYRCQPQVSPAKG